MMTLVFIHGRVEKKIKKKTASSIPIVMALGSRGTTVNLLMFGDQISGASFPVALFRSRTLARSLRVLTLT